MKHARLELARGADLLPPLEGSVVVFGEITPDRLRGLDVSQLQAVSDGYLTTQALKRSGIEVTRKPPSTADHAVVFVPRSKVETWHLIALALRAAPNGWIVVDGQKTDGIDSIAKQIARSVKDTSTYSKGHGKTVWFRAEAAQGLCEVVSSTKNKDGFLTAPGVFSSDAIDPASAFLIDSIPKDLAGDLADLGAGWGYLSNRVLSLNPKINVVHLIEDNASALDCARVNTTDQRAVFHWTDATNWQAPKLLDAVIMNPPFHTGRAADPSLGIRFIHSAARLLRPGGTLYMVANAHLPYEPALEQCFDITTLIERSNRFKVFSAKRGRKKVS